MIIFANIPFCMSEHFLGSFSRFPEMQPLADSSVDLLVAYPFNLLFWRILILTSSWKIISQVAKFLNGSYVFS